MTLRPDNGIKSSLSGVQISIPGVDKVSTLEDPPEQVQAEIDGYTDVVGDE